MKKFTDEYMDSRAKELKRFLDYCLVSETLKQDMHFEKFLDQSDQDEYKKFSQKMEKQNGEIQSISQITALNEEPNGNMIKIPDSDRTEKAIQTQK